jgi:hypothetical protein
MKTLKFLFLLFLGISILSCQKENDTALFAVPVVKKLSDVRANVKVTSPRLTGANGKVYVTQDYVFYIAQEQGVHIFNNQNPKQPINFLYLDIDGVHDIAVKGNYLFADNYVDLLIFDISNMQNIKLVKTIENTFSYYPAYPEDAEFYDWETYPKDGEIVVNYKLERRDRPDEQYILFMEGAMTDMAATNGGAAIGTGGSYAQFQINKNALYNVDKYRLKVFNISDPINTSFDKDVYMNIWMNGGEFETLFKQRDYLFIGSTQGMFVIDAQDEFNPHFISGFSHATACDPVVVFGNTAYITVRGGNTCGAIKDQLNVLDISNIYAPILKSTYFLNQPMGLGIRYNELYVCTGSDGLKVFDATNSSGVILKNTYNMNVTDVIPMNSHLILVGPGRIIQMKYEDDFSLSMISETIF